MKNEAYLRNYHIGSKRERYYLDKRTDELRTSMLIDSETI